MPPFDREPNPPKRNDPQPEQTFLEYLCLGLLGPPVYHGQQRHWHCPFCDPRRQSAWMSFTVRPPKRDYPIKYRCHRCSAWGDEFDLVKKVYRCHYEAAKLIVRDLLESYRRDVLHPDSPLDEESYEGYGGLLPSDKELCVEQLKRELAEEDRLRELASRVAAFRRKINADGAAKRCPRRGREPNQ
jgi:hypothetical protein